MQTQKRWELYQIILQMQTVHGFKKSTANFEHIYSINNSSDPDTFSGTSVDIE